MFGEWDIPADVEMAARTAFMFLERTDWHVLPGAGGWFEQDERLMGAVATLAQMAGYVYAQIKADMAEGD